MIDTRDIFANAGEYAVVFRKSSCTECIRVHDSCNRRLTRTLTVDQGKEGCAICWRHLHVNGQLECGVRMQGFWGEDEASCRDDQRTIAHDQISGVKVFSGEHSYACACNRTDAVAVYMGGKWSREYGKS